MANSEFTEQGASSVKLFELPFLPIYRCYQCSPGFISEPGDDQVAKLSNDPH